MAPCDCAQEGSKGTLAVAQTKGQLLRKREELLLLREPFKSLEHGEYPALPQQLKALSQHPGVGHCWKLEPKVPTDRQGDQGEKSAEDPVIPQLYSRPGDGCLKHSWTLQALPHEFGSLPQTKDRYIEAQGLGFPPAGDIQSVSHRIEDL